MPVSLGYQPDSLSVILTSGSVFTGGLNNTSGDWDGGITIALIFDTPTGPIEWDATIDGPAASWQQTVSDVAAVIAAGPTRARLWYTAAGEAQEWATGTVTVTL